MTLQNLRDDLYSTLGYNSTPAADVIARLDRYINTTYREIITMRGLAKLRRSVMTFACTANTPFVTLPQAAVRIAGIQDRTTQKSLKERLIQDIRYGDPGLTLLTSNPDEYAVINYAAAITKDISIAAGSKLFMVSDSASDVGTGRIEGYTASGYPRSESFTLNGTTQVGTTALDWLFIQKFYVDTAAAGNVTLVQPVNGVIYVALTNIELSRIPIGLNSARYTRIHLHGTPTQALTYYADVELHIENLLSAGDTPVLPEDFHYVLNFGAMKKDAWRRRDWNAYNAADVDLKIGLSALKGWAGQRTDDGRTGRMGQFSQLGPWYKSGT